MERGDGPQQTDNQQVWEEIPRLISKCIDSCQSIDDAVRKCNSTFGSRRLALKRGAMNINTAKESLAELITRVESCTDEAKAFEDLIKGLDLSKFSGIFQQTLKQFEGLTLENFRDSLKSEAHANELIMIEHGDSIEKLIAETNHCEKLLTSLFKELRTGEKSRVAPKDMFTGNLLKASINRLVDRVKAESMKTELISNVSTRKRVGTQDELGQIIRAFGAQVDANKQQLAEEKAASQKDFGAMLDEQEEDSPPADDPVASNWKNALLTDTGAAEESEKKPLKHWGDYSSSEEEDDQFSSLIDSFGSKLESKSHLEIPKDFKEQFPSIYKSYRKIAEAWGWELRETGDTLAAEGFIAINIGTPDSNKAQILSALKEEQKVALNTFVAFLGSVIYRPGSISAKEKSNLVSGYVTSLFLKDLYKNDENNEKYLKIALKGSDAGRSVIHARLYQCFLTGSKCVKLFINNVEKMLAKIIKTSSNDVKKDVLKGARRCFTSYQGMMQNCFRTVSRKEAVMEESSNQRGGKKKPVRRFVTKQGKDRPNLNASNLELTQKELETLRARESSFNKLEEVINTVISVKRKDCDDPLVDAKVTKAVIDLAYDKIGTIRQINKTRRNAIRSRAQEIAGEGKQITSAHWLKAKGELVSSFQEIDKSILDALSWDTEKICRDISL